MSGSLAAAEARPSAGARPGVHAPATFVVVSGQNEYTWRALMPARALGAKVAVIPEAHAGRVLNFPNRSSQFPWQIRFTDRDGGEHVAQSRAALGRLGKRYGEYVSMTPEFPTMEGTVVFQRPGMERGAVMLAMQQQGMRTVAECDDNYLAPVSQVYYFRFQDWTEQKRLMHVRGMCSADAMVFSTRALRDIYARGLKKMGIRREQTPDMFVCRNSVPRDEWPTVAEHDGPLRVGFMGSMSHVWDVNLAYSAFSAASQMGCETVAIGYNPADPDPHMPDIIDTPDGPFEWRSEKSAAYKAKWQKVISKAIPWVEPEKYHRAALPLDIGLCPVQNSSFTAGKSDAKAIEYGISGAAVVCQNIPLYNSAGWKHEVNCLMANSPRDFAYQTIRLIKDRKLRYELVTAAQDYIYNERNEVTLREEWGAAISG